MWDEWVLTGKAKAPRNYADAPSGLKDGFPKASTDGTQPDTGNADHPDDDGYNWDKEEGIYSDLVCAYD